MAIPDKIRNSHECKLISLILSSTPQNRTMPHVNNTIIDVLMAVAKSEFTSLMPILANIAVNEANRADNNA